MRNHAQNPRSMNRKHNDVLIQRQGLSPRMGWGACCSSGRVMCTSWSARRVQKTAEPSRNYHQSKINVASTRRDGRRVQTHLGCVCAREPQNHFMRLQNLKYSGRSMSPFTSCGKKWGLRAKKTSTTSATEFTKSCASAV